MEMDSFHPQTVDNPYILQTILKKNFATFEKLISSIPQKAFKGFIFDCDGTLADTMPHHFVAWRDAIQAQKANFDFTWDLFYSLAGVGLFDTIVQLNQRFNANLDLKTVSALRIANFNKRKNLIQPITPVLECAKEIANYYPVAIASGGQREEVLDTLKIIGAADLFKTIITIDDVNRSKPAPDTFLLAANKMNVEPSSCLVFEDSKIGLEAADNANMNWVYIDPEFFSTRVF